MSPSKKVAPTRQTNSIPVPVCFSKKKKKFKPIQPITINIANKEEVCWMCDKARVEVNFDPEDTPFLTSRFRGAIGGGALSGVPSKLRAKQKTYTYTVTAIAINKPNKSAKKSCSKVNLVCPVKEGKPLPMVEGELTIRFRKELKPKVAKTTKK